MSAIVCVVAHPDDECFLGAGLARFASEGHQVYVGFLADGEASRPGASDIARRFERHQRALDTLGAIAVFPGAFADQRLDVTSLLDITRIIEGWVKQVKPSVVYTHSPGDLNSDHRRVYEAVLPAVRPKSGVKEVYSFAGPRMMSFHPTSFVAVTAEHLERQREALHCYGEELAGEFELLCARQVEHGYVAGVPWAEGFETVRVLQ